MLSPTCAQFRPRFLRDTCVVRGIFMADAVNLLQTDGVARYVDVITDAMLLGVMVHYSRSVNINTSLLTRIRQIIGALLTSNVTPGPPEQCVLLTFE